MATNTTNYNLKKPAQTDFYDVDEFNANMDIIDAELKAKDTKDAKDNVVTFTEATSRVALTSGGTLAVLMGRIKKYFTDLKPHAFEALVTSVDSTDTTRACDANAVGTVYRHVLTHEGNKSNPHAVTASQVGLGNVNNTSDANKPVSNAQQTAINGVQTNLTTHVNNKNNPHAVTKAQVGLGNVDNTADAVKSVQNASTVSGLPVGSGGYNTAYVPQVVSDGVMDIGKTIDFHSSAVPTTDYSARITVNGSDFALFGGSLQTKEGEIYNKDGTSLGGLATSKFDAVNVVNNLKTTGAGYALDARQGKVLNDNYIALSTWTKLSPYIATNAKFSVQSCDAYSNGILLYIRFSITLPADITADINPIGSIDASISVYNNIDTINATGKHAHFALTSNYITIRAGSQAGAYNVFFMVPIV